MQKILKIKNTPPLWGTPLQEGNQGFTLVEALVGLAIVLIAVIGPLSVSMNGIKIVTQSKNRLMASYLAEEMVEEFKNYRDIFLLNCKDLTFSYLADGTISGAQCGTYDVPTELINSSVNTPQSIPWGLFLISLGLDGVNINSPKIFDGSSTNGNLGGLDQTSFPKPTNFPLDTLITTTPSCNILYLNQNAYACASDNSSVSLPTNFIRAVTLTKISPTILKVEVQVAYAKSGFFNNIDLSINLVDYIYMR